MPFTQKTWADGSGGLTPITAAELNRMEAGIAAAQPESFAEAYMYAVNQVVGWDAGWWHQPLNGESIDTHNGHLTGAISGSGTNTGSELTNRYTCQAGQAGLYRVGGGLVMTVGSAATVHCRITKNNAVFPGCAGVQTSSTVGGQVVTGEKLIYLAVGDYLSLQGYCSISNWNSVIYSDAATWMAVQRVG